jgi:threonine/homoserine efflux transporter RhtA
MKNIRPFGWVIIAINALYFISMIKTATNESDPTVAGIAFIFSLFFLAILDVILYVIYRVTGTKKRECPACGSKVPVGLTVCEKCLFDFRKQANGEPQA